MFLVARDKWVHNNDLTGRMIENGKEYETDYSSAA